MVGKWQIFRTALALDGRGHWNFKRLLAALAIALVCQVIFLSCLCDIGQAKVTLALALDLFVAGRAGIAYLVGERGNGWQFYALLVLTSPAWITVAAYLVLGETG